MSERDGLIVLGDMLFNPELLPNVSHVFMREDWALCTRVKHHKQKILFFLSAMRNYAKELERLGYSVHYEPLVYEDQRLYTEQVEQWRRLQGIRALFTFQPNDPFVVRSLESLNVKFIDSPSFLTGSTGWNDYRRSHPKRLHMAEFYRWQRQRLNILVDGSNRPEGGKWSFDAENRRPLPASTLLPALPNIGPLDGGLVETVNEWFSDHAGNAAELWFPTDREGASRWLDDFVSNRLGEFGPYEDAISQRQDVIFHSALSPLLNCGLLTPAEVIERVSQVENAPLQSLEGFVRQVIGWREFVKGIDTEYANRQLELNQLGNRRKLTRAWWEGTTGLLPLDTVIRRAQRRGYCHHIERLMVLGSAMLMCEVHPDEVYRWFMEMFVDSADWVMRPNVYGMSQHADGGLFSTKPYVSGSSYLRRMSDFPVGDWCEIWDALYWRFIAKHRELLSKNPRMRPILGNLDRNQQKVARQVAIAGHFIELLTVAD